MEKPPEEEDFILDEAPCVESVQQTIKVVGQIGSPGPACRLILHAQKSGLMNWKPGGTSNRQPSNKVIPVFSAKQHLPKIPGKWDWMIRDMRPGHVQVQEALLDCAAQVNRSTAGD